MKEIINVQIGQCGNQINSAFWNLISDEHGIDEMGFLKQDTLCKQVELISSYYNETERGSFVPRTLLIDSDPLLLCAYKNYPRFAGIFREENYLFGNIGTGHNVARGFFTEGLELLEPTLDRLRKESEACDCMQGFQLVHGIGGGTGSGLGCLLLPRLKDEYAGKVIQTFTVFPTPKASDTVVEPYNAIPSISSLIKYSELTYCIDNEALYNICRTLLCLSSPCIIDLNDLVSITMSGITSCIRFPNYMNGSLRKFLYNTLPYPKYHFVIPGYAPLMSKMAQAFACYNVKQLIQELFELRSMLSACDPKSGKFFGAHAVFRGRINLRELEKQTMGVREKYKKYFMQWIPDNLSTSHCEITDENFEISSAFISNTTSVYEIFQKISEQFNIMFKKKAFLHWFTGEGMTTTELQDADVFINEMILDYKKVHSNEWEVDNDIEAEVEEILVAYEDKGKKSNPESDLKPTDS